MINSFHKIWGLLTPLERRQALWRLVMIVIMTAMEMLGVLSITPFLTVLARPSIIQENQWLQQIYNYFGFENTSQFTIALGLATICIVLISSAFKIITLHLVGRFIHLQRQSLGSRLLEVYLHQPYEFFLQKNPNELAKNVLSEVDQLILELLQPLSMLIAQGCIAIAMGLLILAYDPLIAICIISGISLIYLCIYLLARKHLLKISQARQNADLGRFKICNEALNGIKDVKITQTEKTYIEYFTKSSREFSKHYSMGETLTQSPLYIVEAAGYSGLILIALTLLLRSDDVAHVLPALGLYGFAAYRLLPAAQIMYRGIARLKISSAALDNIYMDLSLSKKDYIKNLNEITPQLEIRLVDVEYAYPSAPQTNIISKINISIPANTSLGIAGPSGSGKSTLMDILLGLLEPKSGKLLIDNIPITSKNASEWQKTIGYVPQHSYLSDSSVAANIAFGVVESEIDMQAVERAAKTAQIHDFVVDKLPQGYLTLLGERGMRLSGGQRQRIAIARALYRDPAVLLMDEATSALDPETEEAVNNAVRNLAGQKTIIVIAHRERSLQACNKVVHLKNQKLSSKESAKNV